AGCSPAYAGSADEVVKTPLRLPAVVGLKVTAMLQLAPAASVAPQLLPAMAKSPEMLNGGTVTAPPAVLVQTTLCAALVALTSTFPKESGAAPAPLVRSGV